MNIYVAARFHEKDKVIEIYRQLRQDGHTITADWTKHTNVKPYSQNPVKAGEYAVEDLDATIDSDVFLLITSEEVGGGVSAELGAALASNARTGKPAVYVVGPYFDKNAFYFHPAVQRFDAIEDALKALG